MSVNAGKKVTVHCIFLASVLKFSELHKNKLVCA